MSVRLLRLSPGEEFVVLIGLFNVAHDTRSKKSMPFKSTSYFVSTTVVPGEQTCPYFWRPSLDRFIRVLERKFLALKMNNPPKHLR